MNTNMRIGCILSIISICIFMVVASIKPVDTSVINDNIHFIEFCKSIC